MNIHNEIVGSVKVFFNNFCDMLVSSRVPKSKRIALAEREISNVYLLNLKDVAYKQFLEIRYLREQSGLLSVINKHLLNLKQPATTNDEYFAYHHLLEEINIEKVIRRIDTDKLYLDLSDPTLTRIPAQTFRKLELQDFFHRVKIIFVGKNNFEFPKIIVDLIHMNNIRICQGTPN